jgi:hypothetical protein
MESHLSHKDKKGGGRGKETLFRVAYRNQISLIQIADNKANMIITINTLIITVLIGLSGYGTFVEGNLFRSINIFLPLGLIVATCLLSMVFAIQAARPRIVKFSKNQPAATKQKGSLLFFGTIAGKSLDSYMTEMDELIHSKESIYHTMEIDIYNQGRVLDKKYKLLSFSYLVFMYGFIISVAIFLAFYLFSSFVN